MKLVFRYLSRARWAYVLSVLLAVLSVLSQVLSYVLLAHVLRQVVEGAAFATLRPFLLAIFASLAGKEIFHGLSTTLSHKATFRLLRELRTDLYNKLFRLPLGEVLCRGVGSLKKVLVDHVDYMEPTLAHMVPELTSSLLAPLLLFLYMLYLDWRLALASLLPFVIGILFMVPPMKRNTERFPKALAIGKEMNNAIVEYINGIQVIKLFSRRKQSYQKYEEAVKANAQYYYDWMKMNNRYYAVSMTLAPMGLLGILPLAGYFAGRGSLHLPSLLAIIVLSFGTVNSLMKIMAFGDDLTKVVSLLQQLEDILDAPELAQACAGESAPVAASTGEEASLRRATEEGETPPAISLRKVRFGYEEGKEVLHGIDLDVRQGEVFALVGPSGGGKSTLAKLVAAFWNPTEGEIFLRGRELKTLSLDEIADQISYVSQDNFLFDMSIRENLRLGRPSATDEEVEEAAREAGCYDFIMGLDRGFDTVVGEGGSHLSGGERQRLCIVRALLKQAPILLLDEATSYMDPENENVLQQAISRLVQGKTLLLIAHRLRTVRHADRLAVVADGRIEAVGRYEELLLSSPSFRELHAHAQKGEEQ